MKRMIAMLLVMAMMLALAACGGSGDEVLETHNPEDVTLTVWVSGAGAQVEALQAAVQGFEAETGYTVEFSAPGESYEELMKTKMAANDLPDVFDTHGWSVTRYADYLMTTNDMSFASRLDSQITSVISDADGNMYALPMDVDITGMVYNVDVCAEAGVDVNEIKTWADFEAACEQVKAIGKIPVHMGGANNFTVGWFYDRVAPSYYLSNEADNQIDELRDGQFSEELWVEISTMLDSWVTKGYLNADCVSGEYTADVAALATNECAFLFYGNIAVTLGLGINPDANLGMMPLPAKVESDTPTLIAGENVALGVWNESEYKAEAIELLEYLARPEVAKTVAAATGNKSALTDVELDLGAIQTYLDKYADVRTFPYFDRDYLPSGLWDVLCATGQEVLAQKAGAIENSAKQVKTTFDEKFMG